MVDLRPGEGRAVGLAVAASFFASGGLMIGGSGIEALFFATYGVSKLPAMYLALGGVMFASTIAFGAVLGRVGRGRACLSIPIVLALAAAAGRIALAANVDWITQALWLVQGAAQFLVSLAVWGLAGLVTDTRQAKRFFPLIGAGGVLGYVLGGLATKPLASAIGSPNLLVVWIATLVVVAALGARLLAIGGDGRRRRTRARRGGEAGPVEQLVSGFRYVRRSTLMRWMALGSVLFSLLFFSLYLPFSRAATARYPDPDELAGFFGVFFGMSTGLAFLLSLFVTNRLLARFGVPTVLLVLPLLYVVAFGTLAIDSSFALLAVFRFAQVAWLSGGALSSWEAVINTVPSGRRDQTRAFLYGGPTQVGTLLAGAIALVGESLSPATLFGVGLACASLATVAMVGVRRAYPRELVKALREGRPRVFETDHVGADPFGLQRADRSELTAAVHALHDPDPRVRRVSAHALGDIDSAEAAQALETGLLDDDAGVRTTSIASLVRHADGTAVPAIVDRATDPDATVRLAAIEAIDVLGAGDRAATGAIEGALRDADPAVRAGAASALVRFGGSSEAVAVLDELAADTDPNVRSVALRAMRAPATPHLVALTETGLSDAVPGVRADAARAVARLDPQHAMPSLVAALGDDHRVVRDAAAQALGRVGAPASDAVVDALTSPTRWEGAAAALDHVPIDGRTDDVRRFAAEMVEGAVDSHRSAAAIDDGSNERLTLLRDSLLARSDRQAMLGLRAAGVLRGQGAMSVAIENLSVTDPARRANALEVIESVGARDVVAPLLAMWDRAPAPVDRRALLARLEVDPDDWIRACALLVTTPDTEGGTMTRTLTTLSPMERVLSLRTVSLFAELPPADLQPIAAIAEEHAFAEGDSIAEQGDPGDAMHIIVSGDVSVVVRGDEGERVVAVRSAGDVVGEMAVVTNEPRIAGLVARGDVRVLSIARPEFEAILRERPETALGVIRVLCRRLAEPTRSEGNVAGTTSD